MSVVMQLIAQTAPLAIPKLAAEAHRQASWFRQVPGFEGAQVLVNHAESNVQFMLQFASFEAALAFTKERFGELRAKFSGLVDDTSPPYYFALESQITIGG